MSIKKTVLASLIVSCFGLSTIVEARGGTGGDGNNRGSAGRSDGSGGYGSSSSSSSSNQGASSSRASSLRGSLSSPREGHGGDLIRKGVETRDSRVDHDPR